MKTGGTRYLRAALATLLGLASAYPAAASAEAIDYKKLYQSASRGVVVVYASDGYNASRGTGSIISKQGLVLTNTHVVTRGHRKWPQLYVYIKPHKLTGDPAKDLSLRFEARLVAKHRRYDLALLQIVRPPRSLTVLPLSDLSGVSVGEPTVAIGHPGGGAMWSLTTGKLSAAYQHYRKVEGWHVFQTETAINPGNSGGPLLDGTGAIIGVNTFIVRRDKEGLALVGLSFAVQASTARRWIKQVLGKLPRATEVASVQRKQKLPTPGKVRASPAPDHKPLVKSKAGPAQWTLRARKGKTRRDALARPRPRPNKGFSSRLRPGKVYGGSALKRLFSKADDAFDELDRVTKKK